MTNVTTGPTSRVTHCCDCGTINTLPSLLEEFWVAHAPFCLRLKQENQWTTCGLCNAYADQRTLTDHYNAGIVERITEELQEAEDKAWDALGRYKFQMFGYWAAIWVHLNRIGGFHHPNPWTDLVRAARAEKATRRPRK